MGPGREISFNFSDDEFDLCNLLQWDVDCSGIWIRQLFVDIMRGYGLDHAIE